MQKFVIFFLFILSINIPVFSKSIFQKQIKNQEIEIELNPYYSDIDYYIPFTNSPIPYLGEESELKIYQKLFIPPTPRFLVLELSLNPLPCFGVLMKRNFEKIYDHASITNNFNLIRSITAGFEEPFAASIFLGNVASFKPKGSNDIEGKGYFGLLFSAGNYHIKDNVLIDDNWFESEIKIKGTKIVPEEKMNWSFRIGTKYHDNINIKDVYYFSIYRDRTDFEYSALSLIKNISYEYTFDIDFEKGKITRQLFRIGKLFPFKKSKIVFSIKTGFLWEGEDKYTGILKRTDNKENFQILIEPNFEF